MKKLFYITLILAATALVFNSCSKYDEGPAISLLSKTARITGEWELDKVYYDGEEQDDLNYSLEIELKKDGTGSMKSTIFLLLYGSDELDLEWEFDDTKEYLRTRTKLRLTESWESYEESKILMLKSSEMWIEYEETDDQTDEVHTVKQVYMAK
jgi:hypothetical protein